MIQSMTGFGKASTELDNKIVTVEIKALNSKQADVYIKIPNQYREAETRLRNKIAKKLVRGKVELLIWYELTEAERNITLNDVVIKDYIQQMKELSEAPEYLTEEVLFPVVMRLPEVLSTKKLDFNEKEWEKIERVVDKAIDSLIDFRVQEGKALERDIKLRIHNISSRVKEIEQFESRRIEKVKLRLKKNLDELLENDKIDPNRFEQEIIYYLEKLDINEEKVRLMNHCKYFSETMDEKDSCGRKLGFIAQEMGREINTLGAKANDDEIQKRVVLMKDELEKIKEQVFNVL